MKRIGLQVCTVLLAVALAMGAPLRAAPPDGGTAFMAIAIHDVVDTPAQLDEDAITSDRLVVLLEWLIGNGWTAVSLDDIERARLGVAPLPRKAVLITVDDGRASLYTRVYPLALAYRVPIVAALVGDWMDVPADGSVHYGERTLPRAAFVSWAQAREMQASGRVEFASHSQALHTVVRANPQGNLLPAGQNRIRFEDRHESDAAFRARIRADLARSRERMQAELGRAPRAIVWPYGRSNEDALAMARDVGFAYAMTLEPGPADATRPLAIARFLPTGDPDLQTWVSNLLLRDPWPSARRIAAFDTAQLVGANAAQTDARLGRAIERVVALGVTHVMLDAGVVSPDGRLEATWFPNAQLPMRAEVLGRFAAQIRARTGVGIVLRLPHEAVLRATGDRDRTLALYRELAVHVPFEGLLLEDADSFGDAIAGADDAPWQVARRRESERAVGWPDDDATALQAFLVAARMRPGLEAYWLAPAGHPLDRPSALAEVTLVPRTLDEPRDAEAAAPAPSRRIGLFFSAPGSSAMSARTLTTAARDFQIDGGTVIAWGTDDALAPPQNAQAIAPTLSAHRLPPVRDVAP
ncbi:poly-beta-1,6-N-acetyl-D-glucosamine N-deacetylase PgaB [Lysobacter auxotrophicus]|uniref:Poly-beta-1,6-N-acetyl-D-glucosamine N-deacetylase PgaB n=1 Tax=Lysobacter auxotrophicus TaxID=2992573 RepID=A0ABN6UKB8_9GAMM|nr:poly-beta-1,6-N-acetyl-D-glucosamine N-deacetylase PgaB [Lysobacter auxotrophicus]BDU16696.1 poly-beta-1,6-N-acetyl-D-glucosamine N-deacetylase PgaB [Lysobacter auxotrophicus]